jgi:CheY-like chemotaxis protein
VEVSDNGPGIGPEIRGRIFEPFFTTKDVGQGTGLGLSISHGIAASHGGSLELCQGADSGACFRLTLPVFVESGHATARAIVDENGVSAMRALIVDDEAAIRKLLARLLERRGFEVCEAHSGEAALAIAESAPVSLVLCDVTLPGMNGSHLYRELTIRDPNIARSFVFITGDRSKVHVEDDVTALPVLEKPFTAADLNAVLSEIGIPAAVA